MNPGLKTFLIAFAKQAVNAALVSVAPVIQSPGNYNLTSLNGWEHIGGLVGGAVLSRELLVWLPKIVAWSQSTLSILFFMIFG